VAVRLFNINGKFIMRKKDKLKEIYDLLMLNYGFEAGSAMLLVIIQKHVSLSNGEANKMVDAELKFLRNL